jgi:hypothetical protein
MPHTIPINKAAIAACSSLSVLEPRRSRRIVLDLSRRAGIPVFWNNLVMILPILRAFSEEFVSM